MNKFTVTLNKDELCALIDLANEASSKYELRDTFSSISIRGFLRDLTKKLQTVYTYGSNENN